MYVGVAEVLKILKVYMSVFADVPVLGVPPDHFGVIAFPSISTALMYFGDVLFGTITAYVATLPTAIAVPRPVKLIVALAAELAVYNKTLEEDTLIVTVAVKPPVVTTLAFSKIGPRKLAMLDVVVLAIVMESTRLLEDMELLVSKLPVI